MLWTQGLDQEFVIDLLNGSPMPTDFSALREYLASLPPGMIGLRTWAKRYAISTNLGMQMFEAPPLIQPSNQMGFLRIARWSLELSNRKWLLQQHSYQLPTLAAQLREYIDEWIETGYDKARTESPWSRRVPTDLQRRLNSFCKKNRLQVRVMGWGEVESAWPNLRKERHVFATNEALRLMISFLGSDFRYTVAKCLKCGTYFERTKLREVFKRGAYCSKHSKGAGTDKERKDERNDLLNAAAKYRSQWTKAKPLRCSLWVAGKVNETRRGTQTRITQKWVSRNMLAIEKLLGEE